MRRGPVRLASKLSIHARYGIDEVAKTDIIIVSSVLLTDGKWQTGRYPELVAWLRTMHGHGACLCSACSGIFLPAETGLFDAKETTVHWSYAQTFQKTYPRVPTNPERVLVTKISGPTVPGLRYRVNLSSECGLGGSLLQL